MAHLGNQYKVLKICQYLSCRENVIILLVRPVCSVQCVATSQYSGVVCVVVCLIKGRAG